MTIEALETQPHEIEELRESYRREMACQIIHDSIHSRAGWSKEYLLVESRTTLGYGSVAVGGPWREGPALYEFFVSPPFRTRMFDLFEAILSASQVKKIETQSNDPFLSVMLHAYGRDVTSESILFHDSAKTEHEPRNALFRRVQAEDALRIEACKLDPEAAWIVEADGEIAASGDILYHYNRPYGDIYMKVAEPFRRRGLGAYIVQELKRICYEGGSVPAARCRTGNTASNKTLQKAGFAPCGNLLEATVGAMGTA